MSENTSSLQIVCPSCSAINRVPSEKLSDNPVCGKCRNPLVTGQPINATDQSISRILEKSSLPVVVDCWAPWCGPCLNFAPTFSEVAAEMSTEAIFLKLDTEANQQTAARFQIRSIPTLMLFYQGKLVAQMAGALPKHQFQEWLREEMSKLD
ncbi:thioredoxin TrxC [Cerasicoccus arenae]|nr:thioredoxin TrxC [Cerasicoccus arenae]MBK1857295.1 thioredoxin TrxC [Cerasicoccus arenae]